MELRQLRYFLAVARTLNFTKAAAEVHIAQPPLSRQVANLEAELCVALFERTARGVKLTEAGSLLEERASEILLRVERIKRDMSTFNKGGRVAFKIAFDLSLLHGRTPRIFRFLRGHYPAYDFQYAELSSADQPRALLNGEVDIALGRTRINDEQLEQVALRQEPLILALATDHPVYGGPDKAIRLASVKTETMIFYADRAAGLRDPVLRFLDQTGFKPANTISIGGLSAALGLVAAGVGISIVPGGAVRMRGQDVCYAPIDEEGAFSPVVLSTLKGANSELIASMLAEVQRMREADGF
jgi:LysR family transcriptional regulator, benzoate and cis,cis-muconate-responsive activator of ben and cat genes